MAGTGFCPTKEEKEKEKEKEIKGKAIREKQASNQSNPIQSLVFPLCAVGVKKGWRGWRKARQGKAFVLRVCVCVRAWWGCSLLL